ncbi:MAG: uncharacterized protein PWQ57_2729 [Desulfovibrionales bacterium]|nr:uncharacterized protein [Desulfovibrionales bacterium]
MRMRARLEQGLLGALWRIVAGSPAALLAVATLLAVVAGLASTMWLQLDSDQDKLVSPDLPYQRRYLDVLHNFGDQEYLYLVIRSDGGQDGEAKAVRMAESIAKRLRNEPSAIEDVHYKLSPADMGREVLLYADLPDVEAVAEALTFMAPAMSAWFRDGSLPGLLRQAAKLLDQGQRGGASLSPDLFGPCMDGLARLADAVADGLQGRKPPEGLFDFADAAPRYFFTGNGKLLIMRVMPVKDYGSMDVIGRPLRVVRKVIEEAKAEVPGVQVGLTGRPVLAADEMDTTNADMTRASIVAVIAVGLLFWAVMGGVRRPAFIIAALVMAIAWTFGFALLFVGKLNLLSIVFALVLVGIGVDFGVHVVMRYNEAESEGLPPAQAVQTAMIRTGPSVVLGAVTSVCAFYIVAGSSFLGLAELGIIGGTGILFCLLAMLTVLPAELLVFGGGGGKPKKPRRLRSMNFLNPTLRRPGALLLLIVAVTAALSPGLRRVHFNYNLLELQAKGLASVEYEHLLIQESDESTWYSIHTARSLDDLKKLSARLAALPGVAKVESLLDYLPADQPEKIALLEDADASMHDVPLRVRRAPAPSADAMDAALGDMANALSALAEKLFAAGAVDELAKLQQTQDAIDGARKTLEGDKSSAERLLPLQRVVEQDVESSVAWLRRVLKPEPVTSRNVISTVRETFVGKDGAYQIKATPKENVWEFDKLQDYVRELYSVDPGATGAPISVLESSKLMRWTFLWAAGATLFLVALLLWLNSRSLKIMALSMLPLAAGLVWLLELMGWCGLQFNLANFFAVPILIAIGVDGGVHFLSRWKEMGEHGSLFSTNTPAAVSLSYATTMIGFGGLLAAHHQGLASLGLVMVVGSGTGLLACLFVLPAALKLFGKGL